MKTITINSENLVESAFGGGEAPAMSANLFGGILLDTHPNRYGQPYEQHFPEVFEFLDLNYIRYPDGEMPDGFVYQKDNGDWQFTHNGFNGGTNIVWNFLTEEYIEPGTALTQEFFDGLIPAMSLQYPDLVHPGLLEQADSGRVGFSESLNLAYETGSSFSLVLPEFQYQLVPFDRDPDRDGTKTAFDPRDHVRFDALVSDLENFLEDLFVNGKFNDGRIPSDMIIELGNESFFGWNHNYFSPDSPMDRDLYSAFTMGCLTAIENFRLAHPEIEFKVSMQAHGGGGNQEIFDNFVDFNCEYLFRNIDVLDTTHMGLDATTVSASGIENSNIVWAVATMFDHIQSVGGDTDDIQLFNSAWSANSSDVEGFGAENHGLPAAAAVISYFSSINELGMDYAALWGINAWPGFGSNATSVLDGEVIYSPYAQAIRSMAETTVGTHQIALDSRNNTRDNDYISAAFVDDTKLVVFVAANSDPVEIDIHLEGVQGVSNVWAETIGLVEDPSVFANATVKSQQINISNNSVLLNIENPYELVRIVFNFEDPGAAGSLYWSDTVSDVLSGGSGDDEFTTMSDNSTIYGNNGDDFVRSEGSGSSIFGGAGNDELRSSGSSSVIEAGDGDDVLVIEGDYSTVNAGDGGDTVDILGLGATVRAGLGDDLVYVSERDGEFSLGEGSDEIVFNTTSGISIGGSGFDTLVVESIEEPVVVDGVKGSIDSVDDGISFQGFEQIQLGGGDDQIDLFGASNTNYDLGAGNDNATVSNGTTIKVYGGTGADTFYFHALSSTVEGGAGMDSIIEFGHRNTVDGGAGDDLIILGGEKTTIVFGSGDGNDVLQSFDLTTDTLHLDGSLRNQVESGSFYIFQTEDSGVVEFSTGESLAFLGLNSDQIETYFSLI